MRRPKQQQGQIPFELPVIRDFSKPAVELHKNGRYLLFKPLDTRAAHILSQILERVEFNIYARQTSFWGDTEVKSVATDWKRIEIWQHLEGDIARHPIAVMLKQVGVEVGAVPTLANYIRKEWKRFEVESTPYPVPESAGEATLFERCSVGTTLRCIKDFFEPGVEHEEGATPMFRQGQRYFVVEAGGDAIESVKIDTNAIHNGSDVGPAQGTYEWSNFSSFVMEDYFDDSEDGDLGPNLQEKYPERIATAAKKLEKFGFDLFAHAAKDAQMHSLKRNAIDGKLMRMAKTSTALATLALWGSQKVGVFGSQNVLLSWEKECKRLGITDFVFVHSLADLDKPGRIYLMRYSWARAENDPSENERREKNNYLRKGIENSNPKLNATGETQARTLRSQFPHYKIGETHLINHHPCPHCKQALVRPYHNETFVRDVEGQPGRWAKTLAWTPQDGYMCRNQDCQWTTDNRGKKGAAWGRKRREGLIRHKPGTYIDETLAQHFRCTHEHIKGRMCHSCGAVDGVWEPQKTKRFKKRLTAIAPDEAHNMKAKGSQTYKAISRLRSRRKLPMTGTLISNGAIDAFWIMMWAWGTNAHFPFYHKDGQTQFSDRFSEHVTLMKPAGLDPITGEMLKKPVRKRLPYLKNPSDWWRFLSPKFLRRNYDDPEYLAALKAAGFHVPKVEIKQVKSQMHPQQVKLMLSALKSFSDVYEKHKAEMLRQNKEVNSAFVISQMSTMCTIATIPGAINKKFDRTIYHGPAGGGKMADIVAITKERAIRGEKVFIISDFIEMRKAVEDALIDAGVTCIRWSGAWDNDKRRDVMEQFAEDPNLTGLVAGTREVSEACDFSSANTVICCDELWAPAFQQQAWSRILAPTKQERTAEIFLLMSCNSVDEHKYDTFYAKYVASQQSQDRRVINRRAITVNIQWFAEKVIEDSLNLYNQIRDVLPEEELIAVQNDSIWEERDV